MIIAKIRAIKNEDGTIRQLVLTVPKDSGLQVGDIVELVKVESAIEVKEDEWHDLSSKWYYWWRI